MPLVSRSPKRGPRKYLRPSIEQPEPLYQTRAPLFAPLSRPAQQVVFDPPNLLLTTLAVAAAVAALFSQIDWPNPVQSARTPQAQQQPNILLTTLAPPFSQEDWPNPQQS